VRAQGAAADPHHHLGDIAPHGTAAYLDYSQKGTNLLPQGPAAGLRHTPVASSYQASRPHARLERRQPRQQCVNCAAQASSSTPPAGAACAEQELSSHTPNPGQTRTRHSAADKTHAQARWKTGGLLAGWKSYDSCSSSSYATLLPLAWFPPWLSLLPVFWLVRLLWHLLPPEQPTHARSGLRRLRCEVRVHLRRCLHVRRCRRWYL